MTTCDNISNLSDGQVTRVKLLGIGIVCGLEVFQDTQCFISISKGVGVTSTGQVMCLPDKTLKYYKPYADPNNYFNTLINCKNENPAKKVNVWELIESKEEGATSIVPQDVASIEKPFLDDKVVLLYLEDAAKLIVRILLIDELDMWEILKCTCILKTHCIQTEPQQDEDISIFDKQQDTTLPGEEELYNAVNKKYMLNAIPIRRFGYGSVDIGDLYPEDPDETNLNPNFDFTDSSGDPNKSREKFFKEYELIIDEALLKLDDEMEKLHGHFGCMIDACHCKDKDMPAEEKSPCNPVTSDNPVSPGLQKHNIKIFDNYFTFINKKWAIYKKNRQPVESLQYFYDFIKDLIKTYNELLIELYDLVNDCCPDTDCFPRHLMLGRIKEEVSFQQSIFRQPYLQPPVYNDNANRLQEIRFLHWRMVIMMKCFFIPDWEVDDMSDESYYDVLQLENETKLAQDVKLPVRITPSRLFDKPIGKQAIPFYYNLSESPYSLQYYWDYFSTRHNREDHQLSFFCKEVPGYTTLPFIMNPFLYSLDEYPFYRVEGHTGMNGADAIKAIRNLRRKYALSFDAVLVTFGDLQQLFSQPPGDDEFAAYGLEHVGGVQKGYTLLLLHDGISKNEPGLIVADFQVPFMVIREIKNQQPAPPPAPAPTPAPPPEPPAPAPAPEPVDNQKEMEAKWKAILARMGAVTGKNDLTRITGINTDMEKALNNAGIGTWSQMSQLTKADFPVLAAITKIPLTVINPSWIDMAAKLAAQSLRPAIKDIIGVANGKDNLKAIKGISTKTEGLLNEAGITTYEQLTKLTAEDIPALAKEIGVLPHVVKEDWFTQAATLMNKK